MKLLDRNQKIIKFNNCDKGKHKLRTNKFGVTWCVYCGLLSNSDSETLQEDDKVLYV